MKQYTVTGMSCAACSARVEKAVSKVDGVTRAMERVPKAQQQNQKMTKRITA